MEILGKTPINPMLFITGKLGGYISWAIAVSEAIRYGIDFELDNPLKIYTALILVLLGLIFLVFSSIFLGKNVRMGIPLEETKLKTLGIYKISRNPMYIGLHLITLSSIVFTLNIFVIILGLYSIFIYHLIILKEEVFLVDRFGNKYEEYKKNVRRYI